MKQPPYVGGGGGGRNGQGESFFYLSFVVGILSTLFWFKIRSNKKEGETFRVKNYGSVWPTNKRISNVQLVPFNLY